MPQKFNSERVLNELGLFFFLLQIGLKLLSKQHFKATNLCFPLLSPLNNREKHAVYDCTNQSFLVKN